MRSFLAKLAVLIAITAVATSASAADRMVLMEFFTALW
jgi:hypothetical protein